MTQAKQGDTVKVHYNLKLKDGRAIVSTASGEPLEFKIAEERSSRNLSRLLLE